jgi:putative membrane protein insertion efficiency factor
MRAAAAIPERERRAPLHVGCILNGRPHDRRSLVSRIALLILKGYQRWLSPLIGSRCRFHPSCSDYARVAIARFGALRGGWLGIRRILRCQPLCEGGIDPVPERFTWWPRRKKGESASDD